MWRELLNRNSVIIFLVTVLAYSTSLSNGWIWDDDDYVTENQSLRSMSGLVQIWFEPPASPQYYPIVFSTFWLIYQIFGLWPVPFHLLNIVLHGCNAVLLFTALVEISRAGSQVRSGENETNVAASFQASFWTALLFGIHPIHVESVAWVTEFKNVGSAFFFGCAWILIWPLVAGDEPTAKSMPANRMSWAWTRYFLALASFTAALLCKSVTATFGCAVLVVVWYLKGKISLREVRIALPFIALGVLLGWNTARLEIEHVGADGADWSYGMLDRIGIAARSVLHYVANIVLPVEQMFFYPRFDPSFGVSAAQSVVVCCVIMIAFGYLAYRGQRGPLAGALFFGGSAFPALGFLNVYPHRFSFVADHFVYIPMIGVLAVFVSGMCSGIRRLMQRYPTEMRLKRLLLVILPVYSLLLIFQTNRYTPAFADEQTLWEDTLSKNPDCPAAWHNLAHAYLKAGDAEYALKAITQALTFEFDRFELYNTLGLIESARGNTEAAEEAFRKSIAEKPSYVSPVLNLAKLTHLRAKRKHTKELWEQSRELYQRAYGLRPDYDNALLLGLAASDEGDWSLAENWFQVALSHSPGDSAARFNLAISLGKQNKFVEAIAIIEKYRSDFPKDEAVQTLLDEYRSLSE